MRIGVHGQLVLHSLGAKAILFNTGRTFWLLIVQVYLYGDLTVMPPVTVVSKSTIPVLGCMLREREREREH